MIEKHRTWHLALAAGASFVLAALLLAATGCTTRVVSETGEVLNTVSASGTGETAAPPDQAEMSFGITERGADAKTVLDAASKTARAITDAVKKQGVDDKDIQTQNVNLWPQYDYRNDDAGPPRITGYEASISVRVTLKEIEKVGEIIAAATDSGANNISGPSFTLSEDAEARDEAIEKAVDDARRRAEVMAKAAGKNVGDVVSIAETGVSVPPVYYESALKAADLAAGAPAIEPGTLDISASVTVVFELR